MNTSTINVGSEHESIQNRIAELANQTSQLTHTVFNRYLHRTSARSSIGVHMDTKGGTPVKYVNANQVTTSTQTTFFFAPDASRVDASIFFAGTWFFIQNQVWCLLENLVSVQIQDMYAFTSALSGRVNGVRCIGLARRMCHKHTSPGNNDTHIRAVMVAGGELIILPPVYTGSKKSGI
jgi:hypothetical protein